MFKNVTVFVLPLAFTLPPLEELEKGLAECALKDVGPLELASSGFVRPYGDSDDRLAVDLADAYLVAVGTQSRVLPQAAIAAKLQAKLKALEEQEGRVPGGKTRKRLRDEIITDMLPNAPVVPARTLAVIDRTNGRIYVDSASGGAAEAVVSEIRRALGSLPAVYQNAEVAPRSVLTGWIAGEALPEPLALGSSAELRDPVDNGAVVKLEHFELVSDEVTTHLEGGRQCVRLELYHGDRVRFTVDEALRLRKLALLDGAIDTLENQEREDIVAELNARLTLFLGELRLVYAVLAKAFKVSELT